MKMDKILDWIEKIVVWALTGLLIFVGLGRFPLSPTSLLDFADSLYYFAVAIVVCPKTPIGFYKRLLLCFLSFLYGVWMKLI
ncbi:hypothetical protein F7734_04210 [Scytonema sp. UIC 10036]|uniref:hypothetical protein n=1 Tax=Scytonema sp. UIC 10036 TaxID=2304196 RepID=UPI0012DA4984|nr:hypothetical protein [Scytonema sp. UIC 10036]MUG91725.1 hypothetical protein [Scytonema sp. UIC 10036]